MKKILVTNSVCIAAILSVACRADIATLEPVSPFRSDLWQLEYFQKDQEEREQETEASPTRDQNARKAEVVNQPVDAVDSLQVAIPGQADLKELTDETPIAEWQVDWGATTAPSSKYHDQPTAWELSREISGGRPATNMSKGPTLTTYLVGIVACIVVTGALLSGRE